MDRQERANAFREKTNGYGEVTKRKVQELKERIKDARRQSDKEMIDELEKELATYPKELGGKV